MARTAAEKKKDLLAPRKKASSKHVGLSTGSTLLNAALTDDVRHGFFTGNMYHIVGASDSGKTWTSLTCLAEAARNPAFKDYRFIFDDPENGAQMNLRKFFGEDMASRLESPRPKGRMSRTVEEFYYNMDDAFADGRPFIWVLDSMDALDAKPDQKKFAEHKKSFLKKSQGEKAEEEKGTYGTAKAKANAGGMRVVFNKLLESQSILILISQERYALGYMQDKTWGGGTALKFFCHGQVWTNPAGAIKKKVLGKMRDQGTYVQAKVTKNRMTGRKPVVSFPIYWDTGLDDVGGNIRWMVMEGVWKKVKGVIKADELGVEGKFEELVRHVQDEGMEDILRDAVQDAWVRIRDALAPKRKNPYAKDE